MSSPAPSKFSLRKLYASWDLRSHGPFLLAMCLIIPLGLWSRRAPAWVPLWFRVYGGDILWAMNLYCLLRFLWPSPDPHRVAIWTALTCLVVEVSQLWQAPWLVALRHTRVGALLLGRGFLWSDLICYAVGVLLMWALDKAFQDLRAIGNER